MNIKHMSHLVHKNAIRKGFHTTPRLNARNRFIDAQTNNLHDEVSELHDAWRKGNFDKPCDKNIPLNCGEEEYADIVIRVMDQCARLGINLERAIRIKHGYNTSRPYKHGGKKT